MDGLAERVRQRVSLFVRDIAGEARRATLANATNALNGKTTAKREPNRKIARRGAEAIEAVKVRVLAAVASKPGLRSEELRSRLRLERRELVPALRALMDQRAVRMTGAKRGARYFPTRRMTSRSRRKG